MPMPFAADDFCGSVLNAVGLREAKRGMAHRAADIADRESSVH
jgi:hypothetical protein